mgnify:CR=1 FL=1
MTEERTLDAQDNQGGEPPSDTIVLRLVTGRDAGRSFAVPGPLVTVGRSAACDIPIRDQSVSRIHMRIRAGGGRWFVQDLWSRNGTQVHGKRIAPGIEVAVREGDRIAMGATTFFLDRARKRGPVGEEEDTALPLTADSMAFLKEVSWDRSTSYVKHMELVHVMSKALMETVSLPDIFKQLVDYLFELFKRVDRAAILRVDPDTGQLEVLISRTRNEEVASEGRPYSRTIVDQVLEQGTPVVMQDFDEEMAQEERSDSQRFIRSVLCVPMISRNVVRGIIYADSLTSAYSFRKADAFLLDALSGSAAVAIENATLVADLEQAVERKTQALRKTQEQLQESEIRFRAIFRSMNSGAMVLEAVDEGKDFRIVDVNHAALRIEAREKEDVTGKVLTEIQPFAEPCGLRDAIRRTWEDGRPETLSLSFSAEQDAPRFRDYYLFRLPSHEIVALYDDLTEKKRAEREQRELQMQLFRAQKLESIGLIALGVAHNIRNILQAVSGNVEYLELIHGDSSEVREIAKSMYNSVQRGSDLTRDLLHFSKCPEEGEERFAEVDLSEIITGVYNIISRAMDPRIEIVMDLEPNLLVQGNASLLSQVFMNLFTNARDAMPEGGELRLTAHETPDQVVVRVSDTGIGMSPDVLERIFDPFFTLKDVGKGTGLGLSTSRGIVEQHGGRIEVSSRPGKGSTFEITLPRN